ncbi:MAG: OsmC family peroxiredoxin [Burkholderiaceae bacterium]|nr:MAG: OsmC family peroxiredoxin [Burkholderiaceae bacterium]
MPHQTHHHYSVSMTWTGNRGAGTETYRAYARDHVIHVAGKPDVPGSSDPAFFGDAARYNPEELFVAALSACHMLWYLHLCANAGISVLAYADDPEGVMAVAANGSGRFERVVLKPRVRIRAGDDAGLARSLHEKAHAMCFIANSVNCELGCEPDIRND